MNEPLKGVLALMFACVIWGLSPLYYKQLAHIDPLEVLSHRTLWSFLFFASILLFQKRLSQISQMFANAAQVRIVIFAAAMISLNWGVFIWSIQVGLSVEASLGYYIFPLVSVLFGYVVFKERLGRVQWFAIALVTCAVLVLTVGLGVPPYVSIILAVSLGCYGVFKKKMTAGPVVSVTAEVLVLLPLALMFLGAAHLWGWGGPMGRAQGAFGQNLWISALLILSGPLTGGPLVLFSYASKRISMASVGIVHYINPTLQFGCATLVFKEVFTPIHAVTFALIWTALIIYSIRAVLQERTKRQR